MSLSDFKRLTWNCGFAVGPASWVVSEVNSKANSEAKEISSNAQIKDLIPSPTEKKKKRISYIERFQTQERLLRRSC